MNKPFTLAVVLGNRDFFPDVLVAEARAELLRVLGRLEIRPVLLEESEGKSGSVETWQDAKRCAELFRNHKEQIDGILVCLPNFGDEKGVADAIRYSNLNVPVLVQACPDDLDRFGLERRRDAFCGKISVAHNLRQYRIPFTLTGRHVVEISAPEFSREISRFRRVCAVANGLRRARVGAIGARPNAFNTTRFSEKLLESAGISVNTVDLSEVFGWVHALANDDPEVRRRVEAIREYAASGNAGREELIRMAKFAAVVSRWMDDLGLQATAVQCWTSMQKNLGINVCTVMSMMSERLMPSACEVDIAGVVSMYALQLASGRPSALVDWNNNYGDDPDQCVFFHCGNWAKDFLDKAEIATAPILGTVVGERNTIGAMSGRTPPGPVTYARVTTDDVEGRIRAYAGEGEFTGDPLETFGTKAVVSVRRLQELLRYICKNGFEHHAAMSASHCADALVEGLETYLGWEVHLHA